MLTSRRRPVMTMLAALLPLFLVIHVGARPAHSTLVVYSASDAGAGSTTPRPNSDAMAADFDNAAAVLGPVSVITFESAPLGPFTNLNVAPGVTIDGIDLSGGAQTIRSTPAGTPDSIYGYNTTAGGRNFVYMLGNDLTFTFAQGVQAFGVYISGIQFTGESINFYDGANQSIPIPGLGFNDGGIAFVGFTNAGKDVRRITIRAFASPGGHDFLGIDDVRYVPFVIVPEPSTLAMLAASALTGLALLRRRA